MKTLQILVLTLLGSLTAMAQDQSPLPQISKQLSSYYSQFPREKVFLITDKQVYRPGETIWFSAIVRSENNQPATADSQDLFIKVLSITGEQQSQELFRLTNGFSSGDLLLPDDLKKGTYVLAAYTIANSSPDEISYTSILVDPLYSNQWVAKISFKDSISVAQQKNELYLELCNLSGEIEKNVPLKYQITNGNEVIVRDKIKTNDEGKATIPFTIPAKTNSEPFVCELTDNRDEWKHRVLLRSINDPLEIRFYPEGGSMISGTITKVGFTAFNKAGIPVDLEGQLKNQDGKIIAPIRTFTKGLGLFSVDNAPGQKYTLVVSSQSGLSQSFDLPAQQSKGMALAVVKSDPEFITANLIFADQQKHPVCLVMNQGGSVSWAADLEIDGSGRIKIPTENIPQGINQLLAFSKEGGLLGERLVFADKKQGLKIDITPDKNVLKSGDFGNVKVRITDDSGQPIQAIASVTVADQSRLFFDRPEINFGFLSFQETETPFSLIRSAFKDRISNSALLDAYLIANRLKGFNWNEIRNFKPESYQPPKATAGISGIVTDKNGNRVDKAKVSLINSKTMQVHTTTTNTSGQFSFANMSASNVDDYTAKATDQDGKRELSVALNKNFDAKISEYIRKRSFVFEQERLLKLKNENYFADNEFLFQKAPKVLKNNISYDNQRRMLETSTNLMDVIKSIKPYKIMNNQIVFIGTENSINYQGGALIVLDGQQMGTDISAISNISPMEVDHINVSTNPMDIQRYTGLNSVGVIEIFQKKAKAPEAIATKETKRKYEGNYRVASTFETTPPPLKRDNRTTLLWIPDQKVSAGGEFEFKITAGRVISDFLIEVQATGADGRSGSGKATITVVK